jgi:hypothetical protein
VSVTDISCKCGCVENDGKPMIQYATPKPTKTKTKESLAATPQITRPASENSKTDYTIYRVEERAGHLVGVIMETKVSKQREHAIAQLLGYMTGIMDRNHRPPVGILITETTIDFLILAFRSSDSNDRYINALHLGPYNIFESTGTKINEKLTSSILALGTSEYHFDIQIDLEYAAKLNKFTNTLKLETTMSLITQKEQEMQEKFEQEKKEMQEKLEQIEQKMQEKLNQDKKPRLN